MTLWGHFFKIWVIFGPFWAVFGQKMHVVARYARLETGDEKSVNLSSKALRYVDSTFD